MDKNDNGGIGKLDLVFASVVTVGAAVMAILMILQEVAK